MTVRDEETSQQRTASVMRDTADQLEDAEAILHRSAERSPAAATKDRLHNLGDQVTAVAGEIARRADRISEQDDRPGPS
ncbi:hypothetical protein ACPPVO_18775 [Dactylosporangium sp. McL0621]|uniref:hypothetical protein n=1 Tax=Dactylosporangium sp. McL0621 TaxID=3415678 RepID=UPI003CEE15D7